MLVLTGGAGFIGSRVLEELNWLSAYDIIVVDDLSDGRKMSKLAKYRFADYFDFREFVRKRRELKKITGIIHLGAISDTRFTNGRILAEQNYTFSKEMLELAIEHECRMVYASSASVYGTSNEFRESPECESPDTAYAASKLMFDNYVRQTINLNLYDDTVGRSRVMAPVVGLRYFNVYGRGEELKGRMASFPYQCVQSLARGENVNIFEGDVPAARDFVSVTDVVHVTLHFAQYAETSGIYNVGTGNPITFRRVAELAGAEPSDIVTTKFPDDMVEGYQNFTQANLTKLRKTGYVLNFTPPELGIPNYATQLRENMAIA
jgi:ADP-L-glycero-D-manno-heptose 6-epimerase